MPLVLTLPIDKTLEKKCKRVEKSDGLNLNALGFECDRTTV